MSNANFTWTRCHHDKIKIQIGEQCDIADSVTFGQNVRIGARTRIGANTVLLDNVVIGEDCFIGPNCVIGELTMGFYRDPAQYQARETSIGAKSVVRTGNIISENVSIGENFQSGPYVSIRENTKIGIHCSVGNYSDIQPDIHIGDYSRLHSNVHLTEGAVIGKYVWIMPNCVFTNDNLFPVFSYPQPPTIGDYCVLGATSLFYPGVRLGKHVVVAAGSKVKGVFGDFDFIAGDPAKRKCDARKFFVFIDGKSHFPYPWPKHIGKHYPWKDAPPEERQIEKW